uniref:Chemosensory protein n=1 Tax=Dendrolimus houi TaxID=765132 RepID=A0A076ED81_9NEOP|nr:chemosensory protein [Dendrolimus houi]
MRGVFLLCLCAYVVGQNVDDMVDMPKYDQRYDYLDVDAVFTNKRLVRNYVNCLINAQRCSPEGKQLKRILPEALRTKCVRCTDRQKKTAVKMIRRLKYEYPEEWMKLSSRWDPTGDFTRYFEEFLAKENSNIIPGSGSELPSSVAPAPSEEVPSTPEQDKSAEMPVVVPLSIPSMPISPNRFSDGELMLGSSSSASGSSRPTTVKPVTIKQVMPTRPTMWTSTDINTMPTRFTLGSSTELQPLSTAITFIDQIGYKIIRTTELVTDILKNTVRAVVG